MTGMQADRKHAAGPRRRWWHRIPVRARHHWRPVALFAAFLALPLGVFGSSRVVPVSRSSSLSCWETAEGV